VTRQVLVESLVLTGIGAAGGVMFALWGSQWLSAQLSTPADRITLDQSIDWRVIGFATLTTMVTAAIFGLVPAVRSTHVLPLDALRRQGQRVSGDARASISGALIITQVAVSLVLAFGAGLFTQTFARLAAVPLGFDRDRVLVFNVDTARADVGPADRFALYQRLVDIARARPGVAHAAASLWTPIGGGFGFFGVTVPSTSISGRAELNIVTPSWFATYGTAMRAGRDISDRDTAAQAPVVVVNEAFVRKFLPGRSAVGEIVERGSGRSTSTQSTIVGVVTDQLVQGGVKPDGTFRSLRGEAPPTVYVPLAQSAGLGPPGRTAIAISIAAVAGSARLLAPDLAAALAATDRNLSFTVKPLTDEVDAAIAQEGLVAWLSTFFGVLGVLLAGVGV
jgi:hypothetical protein